MKKLLFLIPLIIIALNFTSFSLYKEPVYYDTSNSRSGADLLHPKLKPARWQIRDYGLKGILSGGAVGASASTEAGSGIETGEDKPQALSQGAKYRGFPVAAYFSLHEESAAPRGTLTASARSSFWMLFDGAIVLIAFIAAAAVNFRRRRPVPQAAVTPVFDPNATIMADINVMQPHTTIEPQQPTAQTAPHTPQSIPLPPAPAGYQPVQAAPSSDPPGQPDQSSEHTTP
jgi:hypothetical protein